MVPMIVTIKMVAGWICMKYSFNGPMNPTQKSSLLALEDCIAMASSVYQRELFLFFDAIARILIFSFSKTTLSYPAHLNIQARFQQGPFVDLS